MKNWRLIKLNFGRSQVHFGELGIGLEQSYERVRSDTLFSAWVSNYARLFGKVAVEQLLKQFLQKTPPVRMSSTFIYREGEKGTIYYLPRPLKFPINYPQGDDLAFFKTYKTLNYLPLDVWQQWYQGEGFTASDRQELIDKTNNTAKGQLQAAGTFDYKQAFNNHKLPKIAVDRVTRATNFYHTGYVQFQWQQNGSGVKSLSGLYFLLHLENEDTQIATRLQQSLHLLGEEGLGGERSSGAGQFQVEWLELPPAWQSVVNFSDESAYHCLMSLFWDDDTSILNQLIRENCHSSYEIQERGGWYSESNIRRQMVRMFSEGSVFPKPPGGKLANVTPDELINKDGTYKTHPIYRSGISLSLPIKVQTP